jgi:hypothetical protein
LYGDDASGYVKEILSGSDDFGSAIQGSFSIKAEAFKDIARYKTLKDVYTVLRKPIGSANLSVVVDGTTIAFSSNINTVSPSINFGHYLFSKFLFGVSYGTGAVTTSDDLVLRVKRNLNLQGKVFGLNFDNGSSGASFVLLSSKITAKPRSERFALSTDVIQ